MLVYFASDHAGFEIKNALVAFVRDELGHEVEDCGATTYDADDDYPDFIAIAARTLAEDVAAGKTDSRAIVAGGSGQGEAMVANRFPGVRCAVYYGEPAAHSKQRTADGKELGIIESTREHNNANALSLGLRFITLEEAKEAVRVWLETPFTGEQRHLRRIDKIDHVH